MNRRGLLASYVTRISTSERGLSVSFVFASHLILGGFSFSFSLEVEVHAAYLSSTVLVILYPLPQTIIYLLPFHEPRKKISVIYLLDSIIPSTIKVYSYPLNLLSQMSLIPPYNFAFSKFPLLVSLNMTKHSMACNHCLSPCYDIFESRCPMSGVSSGDSNFYKCSCGI